MKAISGAGIHTTQGPGPITAFAAAPALGVLYASAAGFAAVAANIALSGANLSVLTAGANAVTGGLAINGAAGSGRALVYRTAGVVRWYLRASNTAETGADAGTPLEIVAHTDAGVAIDSPLVIVRAAAGLITIGGALNNRPITLTVPNQGLRINNQVTGAGVGAGTLLNAPAGGNPTFWCPINIAGVVRFFPCW